MPTDESSSAGLSMRARMDSQGWEPFGGGPGQFAAYLRAETPQWANLSRDLDLKQQ